MEWRYDFHILEVRRGRLEDSIRPQGPIPAGVQ